MTDKSILFVAKKDCNGMFNSIEFTESYYNMPTMFKLIMFDQIARSFTKWIKDYFLNKKRGCV